MSKQRRISKGIFLSILKQGKSFSFPYFSGYFLKNPTEPLSESLFSFVVASKTAKKATERNLLRRRGRHIVKKNISLVKSGYFIVFFLKKGIIPLKFSKMEQEIIDSLRKVNLLK